MNFENLFGLLPLCCVAYIGMYLKAAGIVARCSLDTLGLHQAKRVVLECIGAALRKRGNYITFDISMSWMDVFKLTPATVMYPDIERASLKVLSYMRKQRPWTYPASQRDAIIHLMAHALVFVSRRQELEELAKQTMQARRASEQKSRRDVPRQVARPVSMWRTVLGVSASERDASTIKKAYRSRAAKAHPDRGGSDADMARLNVALAEAREELSFV